MPPPAADLEEALQKKGGLTLSQLANYDDLITDALVDRVYFWSTIRKLKANYHACRGVQEEQVCKIIQEEVVVNKDPSAAQEQLLNLPGLAKYHRNLKTADEKEHFLRHLRKYINMYLPDCPFEVGTTNRYTVTTSEAAILARKAIRKGEPIKYLSGIQVEMTEREEKELSSRTDFSIVLSSRRKRPSLFLGPARFANHDCDSNAKLNTTGPHGIHIVARKDIAVGDEITVTYGLDYFGEDNCECLCGTCESLTRNGWDPRGPILNDSSDEESEDEENAGNQAATRKTTPLALPSNSSAKSSKRKREDDEQPAQVGGPLVKKRGRGRPRKHPRPEDMVPTPQITVDQAHASCKAEDAEGTSEMTHLAPKKLEVAKHEEATSESDSMDLDLPVKPRNMRVDPSQKSPRPGGTRTNDSVQRIWQLLHDVAERKRVSGEDADCAREPPSPIAVDTPHDDSEMGISTALESQPDTSSAASAITEDYLQRGVSNQNLANSESNLRLRSGSSDAGSSKLPTIKKQRSLSSLRNVVNADDGKDIFSVRATPAPPVELPKRKRGRPRKHQPPPEKEIAECKSTSPSSAGNDSASHASIASSATSMDVFAAGSIAENICEMFTSGIKPPEPEVVDESTTEAPRRMATRGSARLKIDNQPRDPVSGASSPHISPQKQPIAAVKAHEPPRRSPRTGTHEAVTPPVRSIERVENPHRSEIDDDAANDADDDDDDDEDVRRGEVRTPGDYTLCQILLATPYHRWVECRNCDEYFVQGEAYLTRIACPRCERHSKLYGYYWPKTDRDGKHDREERVLDHRTIHRFIDPEEERGERKGRRTLAEVLRHREISEQHRLGSEETDRVDGRLRVSPRRSESRRKLRTTM